MDKYLLIKNIFIENKNKEKAKSMAKYMKNKFAFYDNTVGVMTNNPTFDWHLTNLNEYLYKMRDDRDAMQRRTFESRMRAVYVQYTGFRMVKMPLVYYLYLPFEFMKSLMLAVMPKKIYQIIHKIRRR